MHGNAPNRAYAVGVGMALMLSACAHAAPRPLAPSVAPELARLRAELAQRDQLITQLEGRLALAEAGQRQLRDELERAYGARPEASLPRDGQRESVRIGRPQAPEPEPEPAQRGPEEKRPLLVLHSDRASRTSESERAPRYARSSDSELTSSWTPPPSGERLSVVPLPALPRRAASARTDVATPQPAQAPQEPTASDDLFLRGLDLLRRHEFAEAQRELSAFVTSRPSDPRVGKAHFFRAEVLYAERDYARALQAYQQSLARDPSGDKAADAMLRSALCQLALGAREAARGTLNALRAKFPDSEAAHKSVQLMQEDSG